MKNVMRMLALILCLCLCLTACSIGGGSAKGDRGRNQFKEDDVESSQKDKENKKEPSDRKALSL